MTAPTPIERAAEALDDMYDNITGPGQWIDVARAVFGSIDEDELAQVMNAADGRFQGRISPSWEALSEEGRTFYRFQVEAVKAWLTGGWS